MLLKQIQLLLSMTSKKKNIIKALFTICLFLCSVIGFMVSLPREFHNYDKQLHAFFYFAAAIVINFIYPKKWVLITLSLLLFGIAIEFLQEFSNKIIGKKIHGNFDIQDVKFNTIGLVIGSVCFFIVLFLMQISGMKKINKS